MARFASTDSEGSSEARFAAPLPSVQPLLIAARRNPLVAEVRKRLIDRCEFTGGRLAVGVSGGADSLALLLCSCAIRQHTSDPLQLEPVAIHVHHHLRDCADDDAEHVAAVCQRLGVPFHLEHVRINARGNVSAEARQARYEALRKVALAEQCKAIAVAHHAEDQFETMLMALGRGAGLDGLGGMCWRRPLDDPSDGDLWLIRPLLGSRKTECEALCRAAGIDWREDPTNFDLGRSRARIRHEVLPIIEVLWPDAARRAAGTAELLHVLAELLEAKLRDAFGPPSQRSWSRDELHRLPIALIAAGIRRAALDADPAAQEKLTQRHLLPAAEAIESNDRKPKTFELTPRIALEIRAAKVSMKNSPC